MPPSDVFFHVQRGPQRFGPYTLEQLCAYARENRLLPGDLALEAGTTRWEPLERLLQQRGVPRPWLEDHSLDWVVPVNRSGWAVAAGYAGLCSLLVVPAPLAIGLGICALRDLRRHPEKLGRGRAWFGLAAGGLVLLALVVAGLVGIFTG